MKINLLQVPIFIGNIDSSKIILKNHDTEKTWLSKTISSHNFKNKIREDSLEYLLKKIWNLIQSEFKTDFKIALHSIWENFYKEGDYQDTHIHPGSHFSFIIYKDVEESKTVFFNPHSDLIESFYVDFVEKMYLGDVSFKPQCRKNQIIVFPSFLHHLVQKHSNSVTIAGNIRIVNEGKK